jgi:error-prone DNA polymerase
MQVRQPFRLFQKPALRLGFRQADGIHEDEAKRLVAARRDGFASVEEVAVRAKLHGRPMRALADADAFRSIGLDRRQALWEVRRLPEDDPLPLFEAVQARELGEEPDARLPVMALGEHVATDYQTMRLSLKAHPMAVLRPVFAREGVSTCVGTAAKADARFAQTAGLVLVRQRPGKGNAIFITLEDETGIVNVVLWARQFERFRREVMAARLMLVEGRVQKSPEGVTHLMATRILDRSGELDRLWGADRKGLTITKPAMTPADEGAKLYPEADPATAAGAMIPPPLHLAPPPRSRHPRDRRILPKSRDFH